MITVNFHSFIARLCKNCFKYYLKPRPQMSLQLEYGNNELSGRHCKITLSALRLFRVLRIALAFSLVACVASVSVGFGSKGRPRKGIFGVFPARNMGREPKNERGGWGRGTKALAPFFARAKHWKSRFSVFLCSLIPRKRLLRRLSPWRTSLLLNASQIFLMRWRYLISHQT